LKKNLNLIKPLEKYKIAESILLPEDGSLQRYGNLLYEFGELDEAKKVSRNWYKIRVNRTYYSNLLKFTRNLKK